MLAVHEVRGALPPIDQSPAVVQCLLTPLQVADVLQVKLQRIYELVKAKRMRAVRIGRQLRFRMQDVQTFLERSATDKW
jgi:excisionase family DNA binding protein